MIKSIPKEEIKFWNNKHVLNKIRKKYFVNTYYIICLFRSYSLVLNCTFLQEFTRYYYILCEVGIKLIICLY